MGGLRAIPVSELGFSSSDLLVLPFPEGLSSHAVSYLSSLLAFLTHFYINFPCL